MPLEVIELVDTRAFTQAFANAVIAKDVATDVSDGYNFLPPNGASFGGIAFHHVAYDFIRDRLTYQVLGIKKLAGGAPGVSPNTVCFDALMRNASIGWHQDNLTYAGGIQDVVSGQPNLQTGQQIMYGFTASSDYFTFDSSDGSVLATDVFPTVVGRFSASVATTGNAGYFTPLATTDGWNVTAFEGITDSTDMPDVTAGGSTHAKGLALVRVGTSNLDGGTNTDDRWIWVDLDTGNAVGELDVPTTADSNSVDIKAEPSIAGQDFDWLRSQFVPDVGSTFAKPKGELHVFSMANHNAQYDVVATVTAPGSSFSSTVRQSLVTVYDFNPFDAQGGTVRVHNRRIFLGVMQIPFEPIIEGGNSCAPAATAPDTFSTRSPNVTYHPPSRTYISHQGTSEFANSEGADDPRVGDSRLIRFRRATTVSAIGQPVPETAVTELRTVRARVDVLTDVGGRAISAAVTFSLFKVSTRDEQFNGTTQGAAAYVVAQSEIDDDGYLEVREIGGVDDVSGVLLVETTDYTVVHSTGTLTPVGSWPTETIHVRYRHRAVRVGTGHGTLQGTSTTTDGNGLAFASILYGDNLDGELDEIEATA